MNSVDKVKVELVMKYIYTLIAPPGAGKTSWLINRLTTSKDQHSLLVFPTKALSAEVQNRILAQNMDFNAIDSSTVKGSVVQCLEENLLNRTYRILICTHESLRLITPETLDGWKLYVDEIPSTWDCTTSSFTDISYRKIFDNITAISKSGDKSKLTVKDGCRALIEGLAYGEDSALTADARAILTALLDNRYVVEVEELDARLKRTIRVIGIKHYIPAFEAAEEAVIMGAEVEKTLLGVTLKAAGWVIRPVEAKIDFTGYGNKVEIHPFFSNRPYSKSAALMKAGKLYPNYQEGCLLDAWLKVDVFRVIGHRQAILVAHQWCQPELPIPPGGDNSNIKFIPIDNRGINEYSDYKIAICLQHGNITPIEARSLSTLAQLLSVKNEVSPEEIKNAVKYERFYESTLQSVCRTSLRSRTSTSNILLFVQDFEIAKFLAEKIGNCEINEEFSEFYFPPESASKANRDNLKQIAISLWDQNYSIDDIAEKVGKTSRTVSTWLKPHRELKQSESSEISS